MIQESALILEVFKQDNSLKIGLFDQGQILPTLRHYSQITVSFDELKQLSAEMVAVLNFQAFDADSKKEQLKNLQKIGQVFWNQLFTRSLKEKLKNFSKASLTLCLDEELIYIPWELIFDGAEFFCLKFSLGRLVRTKGESGLLQYRSLSESLRMLILADPNADLKSAYSEGLNIKNQFNHRIKKVLVDFKSTNIDKNYVRKNICDYDIIHFAGHCEFDKKEAKDSGWVLSDGIFKVEDILKMGHSTSLPALVFSNACYSAKVPLEKGCANLDLLIESEYQKANYGMASAFLFAGVRHYIGSIRKIEDNAGLVFAREFYLKLLSGLSLGESMRLSKLKLVKEFGLESLHWVNYLLYGDPAFVFFKIGQNKAKRHKLNNFIKKFKVKIGIILTFICLIIFSGIFLPRINPGKLYLYFNSQAQFKKGNNQEAIDLGRRVLVKDKDFLDAYPIIASAYQRLGDKEKALKYFFEYVLKSEKLDKRDHLTQAYIKLGWFYHLEGQYDKAKELYTKAIELSRELKNKQNESVALRKLAVWNIDKEDYGQALDLLTKSASINLETPHDFESAKNLACDYFDIGLVYANKNDYPAAKNFYEKA